MVFKLRVACKLNRKRSGFFCITWIFDMIRAVENTTGYKRKQVKLIIILYGNFEYIGTFRRNKFS